MSRKYGSLEAYLRRSGLPQEMALVQKAADDPLARARLVNALHRQKKQLPISPDNGEMRQLLTLLFGNAMDLIIREHRFGPAAVPALILCLNGVADRDLAERSLAELMNCPGEAPAEPEALVDWLATVRSSLPEVKVESAVFALVDALLYGHLVLLLQGAGRALCLTTPGIPHRQVTEPTTETVVRGPREGFTESLLVNTALLRRRIRDERLRIDSQTIGERTATRVAVSYLEGLCRPELLAEVHRRLNRIKIDGVLESNFLEESIEDTTWTVFPLVNSTERPDVVTAALLEGKVSLFTEGTPLVLIVPATFNDMMQSAEDYYERFPIILLVRVLRWLFAAIALLGPAFYVAFTTFHHEMLPHQLLMSVLAAREGVPFPAVIEALIMEIAFEALREAGIRMPKQIGQAISIVGALVIGQAAVQAGIVSAPMVIVVSLTGLASFVLPKFGAAISLRLLRFLMLFVAGTFGAYGLTLAVLMVLVHLLSLRSFGAPYYAPMAPLLPDDLDDGMVRAPQWMNRKRASTAEPLDRTRMAPGRGPNQHVPTREESP